MVRKIGSGAQAAQLPPGSRAWQLSCQPGSSRAAGWQQGLAAELPRPLPFCYPPLKSCCLSLRAELFAGSRAGS